MSKSKIWLGFLLVGLMLLMSSCSNKDKNYRIYNIEVASISVIYQGEDQGIIEKPFDETTKEYIYEIEDILKETIFNEMVDITKGCEGGGDETIIVSSVSDQVLVIKSMCIITSDQNEIITVLTIDSDQGFYTDITLFNDLKSIIDENLSN